MGIVTITRFLSGFEMSLEMVHDEALPVKGPDITFRERFAFSVPALKGILDTCDGTIRSIHALNHGTAHRHQPAFTNWTEHLSSPLKVRKILLL